MFRKDLKKLVGHKFGTVRFPVLCCCCGYYEDFPKYHSCKEYMRRMEKVLGTDSDV
jgi:hypothetical protein